ncbi:hypothetical protein NLG97_g326 [Lecanicillium saksenae]|uniref:Uncharacterized protein n=1 Tax=Lecanicillium saksenae TaxID=468837 RepID=A0ACC1R8A4_9HYPO|nr:hypothetical protein NLG97_g326 [Lecanicillium saksenae]
MLSSHFSPDRSRTGSDLMNVFWIFDEYTDVEEEDGVTEMGEILMDGLLHPEKPRPSEECPLGEMARQFWALGRQTSSSMAERHLLEDMQHYVNGVIQEAQDRGHNRVRSSEEYWRIRRAASGCYPTFTLIELELDFPEEVYRHPALEKLRECAMYSIVVVNDIFSYNIERARGHGLHNLVTVIMFERDLSPAAAVNWIVEWHERAAVQEFITVRARLPSWNPHIDSQVAKYVNGLGYWSVDIRKTREVVMLPRVHPNSSRSASNRKDVDEKHSVAAMQIRRDLMKMKESRE